MKKIILASASPRRKELLRSIGLEFEVIPSGYKEKFDLRSNPSGIVEVLSLRKAKNVAGKVKEGIIIGSDTIVVHKGEVLGKPKSEKDAWKMLRKISDENPEVYSGIALLDAESCKSSVSHVVTEVKIKRLSDKEIKNYVASGEPLDKAGAFGIQGRGALIVESVKGDYSNIVGFSLFKLSEMLREFGIICL